MYATIFIYLFIFICYDYYFLFCFSVGQSVDQKATHWPSKGFLCYSGWCVNCKLHIFSKLKSFFYADSAWDSKGVFLSEIHWMSLLVKEAKKIQKLIIQCDRVMPQKQQECYRPQIFTGNQRNHSSWMLKTSTFIDYQGISMKPLRGQILINFSCICQVLSNRRHWNSVVSYTVKWNFYKCNDTRLV